ncbi:MAG: hypothetical protein WAP51_00895 [Candidatus Sungiibacteriota bacterium]
MKKNFYLELGQSQVDFGASGEDRFHRQTGRAPRPGADRFVINGAVIKAST